MTRVGRPDSIPEIEIIPIEDPVPRVVPHEIPVEPDYGPLVVPERDLDLIPA